MFRTREVFCAVLGPVFLAMMETAASAGPGQTVSASGSGWVTPWLRLTTSSTLYGLPNATLPTPIQVRVTDQNGNVFRNPGGQPIRIPINFRVIEAPVGATGHKLMPGNATSVTVSTNNTGYTSVSLVLGNKNGVYRLAITERYSYYTIDWVRALTPGVTASLQFVSVDTTSHTANGIDVSSVTVRARDYGGNPATGAQISLGTCGARDHKQMFPTLEGAGGLYTGRVTSTVADKLNLVAWDVATNVASRSISSPVFIAGPARRVDIYAVEGPGGDQPVTHALVFALALDSFENKVGPPRANVRFTTSFGMILSTETVANEWKAWVYSATPGVANVTARDTISGSSYTRPIVFPGSTVAVGTLAAPQTEKPYQNHHIKFWKPKGANVDKLIAGEISGKRIVYGVKSPALCGPNIYITYAVNEYDFGKVDKNGDGILEEFRDSNRPTEEERNLLRNCLASAENVFIVPGMSRNSYGETVGGSVVINQGAKAPAGKAPPVQDGKTLAHENTHYWQLNGDDHTEGGKALPPDNIGAADPSNASLKCTNKDILSPGQLEKLRNLFPKQSSPGSRSYEGAALSSWEAKSVYPGSAGNRVSLAFTNSTPANALFAPVGSLRVNTVLSSPTFVVNLRPSSTTLTPSSLPPGQTGTATFTFDVSPNAALGTGCLIELAVTCGTGETFYIPVILEIAAPPAGTRNWRWY